MLLLLFPFYPQETETKRVNNLPTVTQIVSGSAWIVPLTRWCNARCSVPESGHMSLLSLFCCSICGFSLVAVSRSYSLIVVRGLSLRRLLLLWRTGSRALRRQELRLPGSRAQTQQLWRKGLVVSQHVGTSQTRD